MGSRIPARSSWSISGAKAKSVLVVQHNAPCALQSLPEPETPPPSLRTGVVEAVTLLAKAMVATKETKALENSIVKDV